MSHSFGVPTRRRAFVLAAAALLALVVYCLVALGGSSSGPDRATAQTTTATTTFLRILDQNGRLIIGGAADRAHRDEIEVRSWGFGVENPATFSSTTSGAGTAKAQARELTFKHGPNPSWPRLFGASAQGVQLQQALLSVSRTGETPAINYLTYRLEPVRVTKVEDSASGGAPAQAVTLAYGRVTVSYREQSPDGTLAPPISDSWNFATDTK